MAYRASQVPKLAFQVGNPQGLKDGVVFTRPKTIRSKTRQMGETVALRHAKGERRYSTHISVDTFVRSRISPLPDKSFFTRSAESPVAIIQPDKAQAS